jgi:hypothetical protein
MIVCCHNGEKVISVVNLVLKKGDETKGRERMKTSKDEKA